MGLSFHDESSMVEGAGNSLRFQVMSDDSPNLTLEIESTVTIVDQERGTLDVDK